MTRISPSARKYKWDEQRTYYRAEAASSLHDTHPNPEEFLLAAEQLLWTDRETLWDLLPAGGAR